MSHKLEVRGEAREEEKVLRSRKFYLVLYFFLKTEQESYKKKTKQSAINSGIIYVAMQ